MRIGVGVVACGALVGGCATGADMGQRLFAGSPIEPPAGLAEYCARSADICAGEKTERAEIKLTEKRWRELMSVNRTVNRETRPTTDEELYGRRDYWAPASENGGRGDCEDYVLDKRARLIALGWPPEALSIALAFAPGIGLHAALIAQTDEGDYVLDNLERYPRPLASLDYAWVSRQVGADLAAWAIAQGFEDVYARYAAPMTAEAYFQQRLAIQIAEAREAAASALR